MFAITTYRTLSIYRRLGDVDCETSGGAGGGGPSGFKALGALLEEGWVRFDDLRT